MEDINVDINQNPTDKTKILYNAVSKDYNVGSFDEFSKKLQDPSKREAFYKGVGSEYNLGSYDEFSKKVGAVEKKNLGGTVFPTGLQSPLPEGKSIITKVPKETSPYLKGLDFNTVTDAIKADKTEKDKNNSSIGALYNFAIFETIPSAALKKTEACKIPLAWR